MKCLLIFNDYLNKIIKYLFEIEKYKTYNDKF